MGRTTDDQTSTSTQKLTQSPHNAIHPTAQNLSRDREAALAIAKTTIVDSICLCLKAPSGASRWTNNSLEDFTLFTILHLSQFEKDMGDVFTRNKTVNVLQPIAKSAVGVHSLKASLALVVLKDSTSSHIPQAAGGDITELISNVLAKRGKDKEYSAGVFKLSTSVNSLKSVAEKGDPSSFATPLVSLRLSLRLLPRALSILSAALF